MEIRTVAIVGAGRMGRTIALAIARAKMSVLLRSSRSRKAVTNQLKKRLAGARNSGSEVDVADLLSWIQVVSCVEELGRADLVIECVPEDLAIKRQVFKQLDAYCGANTIFATNTSSLSVGELAAVTHRQDSFLGLHFFNPADKMPLVEMVPLSGTRKEVRSAVLCFLSRIGKQVVEVSDTSGFVVNRLLFAMINEAMRLLASGVATAAGIDTAMKLGANLPTGPLELADYIGLDVCYQVLTNLCANHGDRFRPPVLVQQMIREGQLGRKSGGGFYPPI